MKKCKRIEIVIEQGQLANMEKLLSAHQVDSYTFITDAGGLGDRGHRRADEVTGASSNCIFIVTLDNPAKVEQLLEGVRPMLSRFGGLCILTDGYFLIH